MELLKEKVRPSKVQYFSAIALLVASRASCIRRKVGCVLIDERGFVLSTGYNGVPAGKPHCIETGQCKGAREKSGQGLELCEAIHAEQNALLQCKDTMAIHSCFVTATPCIHCLKLLMNTGCKKIYYIEPYPDRQKAAMSHVIWKDSGTGRDMYIADDISVDFKWRGMPNVDQN